MSLCLGENSNHLPFKESMQDGGGVEDVQLAPVSVFPLILQGALHMEGQLGTPTDSVFCCLGDLESKISGIIQKPSQWAKRTYFLWK